VRVEKSGSGGRGGRAFPPSDDAGAERLVIGDAHRAARIDPVQALRAE
jgi:hypothetical protein